MGRLLAALACAGLMLAQRSPVDDAWDLAAKGSPDQAIRVLEGFIRSNPRNADAFLLLGSLLMEKGERAESIARLTEGVRLRPNSADAQNALGEAYSNFGDPKAARGAFEKAVTLKPGFSVAQVNLGLVLVELGEFAAGAPHLDRAIGILGRTPDAAYPHYLRAKIYAAENNTQKTIAELNQAVSLRPDFAEAWSDLGQARKNTLDDAGALAAEKRAVELNPADAIAQYRLGAEYLHQDQPQLALDPLEHAYRLNPEDQSTLNALHTALRLNGKTDEADSVKQKLTELLRKRDQTSANALKAVKLNNQGAALEKTGDLRGALEKYGQAVDLYPSHVPIRVNYAIVLLRLGQWTEGLNQLHQALERDPGNAKIQAALDDALKQAPPASVPQWDDRGGEGSSR
jgi:tetratricopeptide (TPR) repeat protein